MQLAVEDPGANSSNCGEGYSCAYTNTISWSTPTTPLPMELNPQVVFERMFGDGSTAEQRAARRKRDRSILDSLTGSLSRLQQRRRAPPIARASTSTRRTSARSSGGCRSRRRPRPWRRPTSTVPVGVPQTFDEHIKLQFDLLALAFQADITRVGTLLFARDLTGRTYPGERAPTVSVPRRLASRRGPEADRRATPKINRYHVEDAGVPGRQAGEDAGRRRHAARSFAGALRHATWATPNQHQHYDVPHVLVGGAERQAQGRASPRLSDARRCRPAICC